MANAVIGALRVVLGADTAALTKGLKDAQSAVADFGRVVKGSLAALGIGTTFAAFESSIKGAIDAAENLGKASQKLGIPVEELSKLEYAAKISNVSLDELTKTLGHFDKGVSEAASGGTTAFSLAIKAMGISLTDSNGNLKSQSQLFEEVATKFASYEDGIKKNALGNVLFGKSFADLIPLLNQGGAGIQKLKDEAENFGITVSAKTAAAAGAFNDNLNRLSAITGVIWKQLAEALLPALQTLSVVLIQAKKDGSGLQEFFGALATGLIFAIEEIAVFTVSVKRLGIEWSLFREFLKAPLFSDEFYAKWNAFKQAGADSDKQIADLRESFKNLGKGISDASKELGPFLSEMNKGQAPLVGTTHAVKDAVDSFLDSTMKSTAAQSAQADTVGRSVQQITSLKVVMEAYAIAAANPAIKMTDELNKKIAATGAAAGDAALKVQGANLEWENLDPIQKYTMELDQHKAALERVGAASDVIARQAQKDATRFGYSWEAVGPAVASTLGSLSSLSGQFAKDNKALGIASKAFGISQAIINSQIAATKSFATFGPTPLGYAGIVAAIAMGAAAIATISAQSFAAGGSFMVPGGLSTTDNQLIPLNLAAGERVDITSTSAQAGGSAGSTLTVDMRGGDPYYSRANVEKLLNALHTVTADGHQLRLMVLQ